MKGRQRIPEHLSPHWEAIFNRPPAVAPVAEDAREPFAQMASYLELLADAPLDDDERASAIEAMQLCERTHGYRATADGMRYAAQVVSVGVILIGMRARALAERYGCADVGVLFGALIEEWGEEQKLLTQKRRFESLGWWGRAGSPHPLLDDCRVGVRLAWSIDPDDANAPLAYSALIAEARASRGERRAGELAEQLLACQDAQAAIAEVARSDLNPPPVWGRYAFQRRRQA